MTFLKYFFFSIILLTHLNIFGQDYTDPFEFRMLLSGTFGELRGNHFHAGIDIKTQGVEGQKVKAIYDGYVSRIKVSSFGYGKAIYITHPQTGHTSVYAHLQKFSAKIDSVVKKHHYKTENFEINLFPNRNTLKIKQGEVIALSGNSGSSSGAHLHFEIRNTKTANPINPLQFGFKIDDSIAPTLKKLKIYSFDTTLINGYRKDKIIDIKKENNKYFIDETLTINGSFALGILTYDKLNDSYNKNGVYSIQLSIDKNIYYKFTVDELDFSTTRYINAHIDYKEKRERKNKYHRCYKLPNNNLTNYSNLINKGIINIKDTLTHLISLEVTDIYNNSSKLDFNIKTTNNPFLTRCPVTRDTINTSFKFDKANIFKQQDIELHMQAFSLYESIMFHYKTTESVDGVFGKVHNVHFDNTPVHKRYVLAIAANVPDNIKSKTYIATIDMNNKFSYIGGKWQNGFIKAKVKEFGNFCVIADTTKPEITAINIFPNKIITSQRSIKFTIKDHKSGIKSYRGEINGEWVLMEYDHKKNLLQFDIQENLSKGEHTLTLKVIDNVNNEKIYRANFTY
tara:strand:+ start:2872 stop:4572 length:1701 start_codon:yes stop_codon:yes gene_type:complete